MPNYDRWMENLRCRICRRVGNAQFSTPNKFSWTVQVDSISEGFRAIGLEYGSEFFCSTCNVEAEPWGPSVGGLSQVS